jgi:hypothetical protein
LLGGVRPSWYSEPPSGGLSTINAQCESVFEGTPAWRQPRQTKRCLVVAQGFYEWLNKPGMKEKQPYFVKRKDGKLMAFGAFAFAPFSLIGLIPTRRLRCAAPSAQRDFGITASTFIALYVGGPAADGPCLTATRVNQRTNLSGDGFFRKSWL